MTASLVTPSLANFPKFLRSIEAKWRPKVMRRAERERLVREKAVEEKLPRYILSMFPYPSGRLHLGHVRIYTSSDILTRYSRLMGKNDCYLSDYDGVINPMGFDSFGLPAENAARQRGMSPAVWTNTNIKTMKQQLDELAIQFDWREATSNPTFYRWTQELFLKLMNAGLVYKSFAQVNWDPVDKTVLADEQVDESGRSWRSGAIVEKRYFRQWFIKVNAFTNAIWNAEDVEPGTWRDIIAVQRGWIGTPRGWMFYLPINDDRSKASNLLPIFTEHPKLLASRNTELVISNDHWLKAIYNIHEGDEIVNPFTGAEMKVHFVGSETLPPNTKASVRSVRDGDIDQSASASHESVILKARLMNYGGYFTSDKYRDWLVSRQRFWGTPIPAVNCNNCGTTGVSRDDLPITLPNVSNINEQIRSDLEIDDQKIQVTSPIERLAPIDWIHTKCPSCSGDATRECETFDTLFDSSWYFIRYAMEPRKDAAFDQRKTQPVWCYIGGKEHATMHLFYARFITHFLHSMGELTFREPFKTLLVQGVVKGKTYKLDGKYIPRDQASTIKDKKKLVVEYEKMSKSKGNGVDPQELIDTYGTDATRFCLMSYANPVSERLWRSSEEEFKEVIAYLRRVFLTVHQYSDIGLRLLSKEPSKFKLRIEELNGHDLKNKTMILAEHRNKASVDAIYNIQDTYQFRQFISVLHVLTTTLRNNINNSSVFTKEFAEALATLIIMLNPIVPHLSEELWVHFCSSIINPLRMDKHTRYKLSMQVSDQPWPLPDDDYGRSNCFKNPVFAN